MKTDDKIFFRYVVISLLNLRLVKEVFVKDEKVNERKTSGKGKGRLFTFRSFQPSVTTIVSCHIRQYGAQSSRKLIPLISH